MSLSAAVLLALALAAQGSGGSGRWYPLTISSSLGSVTMFTSCAWSACPPPEGGEVRQEYRLDAACGDTLRLAISDPTATVTATLGEILTFDSRPEDPERPQAVRLPLRRLTGSFRIKVWAFSPFDPMLPATAVHSYDLRVRVRGCDELPIEPLPDQRRWPTLRASAARNAIDALLVNACRTRANCYFPLPTVDPFRMPTLFVGCGMRYTVRLRHVRSATINGRSYSSRQGGVRLSFPGEYPLDLGGIGERTLTFEVATPRMEYAVYQVNVATGTCEPLRKVPAMELPGSGSMVSKSGMARLAASTVRILAREGRTTWLPGCTAVRRRSHGHVFFTTAAHCFREAPPGDDGLVDISTTLAGIELAVTTAGGRAGPTVIPIQEIYRYSDLDLAYLIPASQANLAAEPALPIRVREREPRPGQQAIVVSYPGSARGRRVTSAGVYLGRMRLPDGESSPGWNTRVWDLVGIDPERASRDACFYGGSGSTALLADGTVLGAAGRRVSSGYVRGKPDPHPSRWAWELLVQQLDQRRGVVVAPGEFSTICWFSVVPPDAGSHVDEIFRSISP